MKILPLYHNYRNELAEVNGYALDDATEDKGLHDDKFVHYAKNNVLDGYEKCKI